MIVGRIVYLIVLALAAGVTIVISRRIDGWLGTLVVIAAPIFIFAALAMGIYLQQVRHRSYFGPDEVGFQDEAVRMLEARSHHESFAATYPGIYPTVNAVVIEMWGERSLVPMRLMNASIALMTIPLGYMVALSLFESRLAARWAALLLTVSPSLILWAITNEKERAIGLAVLACMLFGIRLIRAWGWGSLLGLFLSTLLLGQLRQYWAAILGWVALLVFPIAANDRWLARAARWLVVVATVGVAQGITTGYFLATNMRDESIRRYVVAPQVAGTEQSAGRSSDFSLQGQRAGSAVDVTGSRPWRELARNLAYVLFGRFDPRGDVGKVAALWLFPDWLMMLVILPFIVIGFVTAIVCHRLEVLLPAGFVLAMIALLTWVHGDAWTTYRFRAIYWPVALVMAAGGFAAVYEQVRRPVGIGAVGAG